MKDVPMTEIPCPRCSNPELGLRHEMVQRLPEGAFAPHAVDRSGPCCFDCQSADNLVKLGILNRFDMARIAVGNERMEQIRAPSMQFPLVAQGLMKPNKNGDFERHMLWIAKIESEKQIEWDAKED